MSIPHTFIQELLNRADIVEVIGRHVSLKKAGANYSGLCPFHGEKTASFSVSPTKQFFHCFGCGKSGDAIGFLMEHTGESFVEAVRDLAGQFGLVVPDEQLTPQDRARAAHIKSKQQTLLEVLERAASAYTQALYQSDSAKKYFKSRGVSDEIAQKYGLGYAPGGWRYLASVFPDYSDPMLVDAGLVIEINEAAQTTATVQTPSGGQTKRYDRFRDRVIFPIRSTKGQCIGFGGRVLDASLPKYLNSPETAVFSKGRELYGLFEARNAIRDKGYCLVTEGYMDVVALAQWGFGNSVATLGTACTSDHVQKLFRATDNVVFSFDGDRAGVRAAHKALHACAPLASDTRSIKFLFLPTEHDPDSFIREYGSEAFQKYVHSAKPLSRFLIEVACENCDLATPEGRAKMSTQAMPLWLGLPDGALKRQLIGEIAGLVQIGSRELIDLWQGQSAPATQQRWMRPQAQSAAPYPNNAYLAKNGGFSSASSRRPWRKGQNNPSPFASGTHRIMPVSRSDQALRLLLTDNAAWGLLSSEEHHVLCDLPEPHGAAFSWLDHQFMEYGAQNWAALASAMQGESFARFCQEQMQANQLTEGQFDVQELRSILDVELAERLKKQEQEVLQLFIQSPENIELRARYEALKSRRIALSKREPTV